MQTYNFLIIVCSPSRVRMLIRSPNRTVTLIDKLVILFTFDDVIQSEISFRLPGFSSQKEMTV